LHLLLWRHAEAEDGDVDLRRELTRRGCRQAADVAQWLRAHAPVDLRILVSPAARTRQTADALGMEYVVVPALAPDARPADVLAAAGWPAASRPVLVVGHQPTLGRAASLVMTGVDQDWSISRGGLWWFKRRQRGDEVDVKLKAVINPGLM